jgi:biopolymer transport protein ExbB
MLVIAPAGIVFAQDGVTSGEDRQGVFSWDVLRTSGVIGLFIGLMAFVLLAVVIFYFLTLRRSVFIPADLLVSMADAMKTGDVARLGELCKEDESLLSRAMAAGLVRRRDGYDAMVEAIEAVGEEEAMRLHQNVGYLALIGQVSPMLGLLGTVYGMILAFQTVAEQAGTIQPGRLAFGIYTALTTTLMGLTVAIPAMSSHVYFRNRALNLLKETAIIVEELIYPFKKGRFIEASASTSREPTADGAGQAKRPRKPQAPPQET